MVDAVTVDEKISASKQVIKKELRKQRSKNVSQDAEIAKLRNEISKLKVKRAPSTHVSEYNLFVRKQIRAGLNFTQAARQWAKYKTLQETNKRRPSAYNQFIGSQMRLGKTFKQAVALWKLAKAGTLGRKGKTRTVTKTIVRRIKSKPKIKYRTRTKTVVRRVKSRPKVVVRSKIYSRALPGVDFASIKRVIQSSSVSKSDIRSAMSPDDEEIAFRMVETYFKEVARLGLKRQLSLDEIINAYLYSLARVKRQDVEMSEVSRAVKQSGMRK